MHRWFTLVAVCAALGCNRGPKLEANTLTHAGIERTWYLLPDDGAKTPRPLVIALHGGGGVADKLDATTDGQIAREARRRGWRVVYPQGTERGWHDGRTPRTAKDERRAEVDDIGYLRALLDHLVERGLADPARVYMMGISNGGFMTQHFAIDHGSTLAAAAAVTAQLAVDWKDRAVSAPVPMMLMNGTADPLVKYDGGDIMLFGKSRGRIRPTADSIGWWATQNRCTGAVATETLADRDPEDGTRVHVARHGSCADGAEVVLYRVEGGGHTWPGGDQYLPEGMIGPVSHDIDGVTHIFDFFARHSR